MTTVHDHSVCRSLCDLYMYSYAIIADDEEEEKKALFLLIALLSKGAPAERLIYVLRDYQVTLPYYSSVLINKCNVFY